MKKKKIESFRNKEGYINLNGLESYREKGEVVEGSNAKTWFNVDGVRILFKEYNSVLPAFGEVLYSKVGNSVNVNCAEYDFAEYNGKKGTISYDFLKEDEVYYNCLELTTQFKDTNFSLKEICEDRGLLVIHNNKHNNLASIKDLFQELFNIGKEDKKNSEIELVKMFCLDTIFWHRDRNLWNYGIIINEVSDKMKFSPLHDNSCVLCLEKGKEYIENMIIRLINGGKIDSLDAGVSVFNSDFGEDTSIDQLINFYENSSAEIKKVVEEIVRDIDAEKIIKEVNNVCKIDEVSMLWIKAVLNYRRITILNGIESVKIIEDVAEKPNVTFSKRK